MSEPITFHGHVVEWDDPNDRSDLVMTERGPMLIKRPRESQPCLLDIPTPRKHRIVRDTSIASYAEGREQFTGRKADVLRWLAAWWNRVQVSPTSAELAEHEFWISGTDAPPFDNMDAIRLYVRRGLSDLQTHGLVESVEKRKCAMTGRTCHAWRVKSR